jgi:hypothetical protein
MSWSQIISVLVIVHGEPHTATNYQAGNYGDQNRQRSEAKHCYPTYRVREEPEYETQKRGGPAAVRKKIEETESHSADQACDKVGGDDSPNADVILREIRSTLEYRDSTSPH